MAFTEQNAKDGYLFFAIAFNAVPGKTYAAQVVQAYEAGMTTQQIVNEFSTKSTFTDIYGADLSNTDFAQAFVANVVNGLTVSLDAAVLAAAEADVVAALEAGLSRGDVIYNVIQNLSSKSVADAEWGPLVQMLQNKVAVAQALTEGEYALDTTDAGALQAPMALVTEEYTSVADAIAQGGALKALLESALAAQKAEEDYADGLGLLDPAGDAITGSVDVGAELVVLGDAAAAATAIAAYPTLAAFTAATATAQGIEIAAAKTAAANAVTLAKDGVAAANTAVNAIATLAAKGKALVAATAVQTAAVNTAAQAVVDETAAIATYNVGKGADTLASTATGYDIAGSGSDVIKENTTTLAFEFTAAATPAQKTALAGVLTALNATVAADKAVTAANDKVTAAQAAVTALDTAAGGVGDAQALLDDVTAANTALTNANEAVTDLETALSDLTSIAAQQKQLIDLGDKATAAETKLTLAGFELLDLDGVATAFTADKDVVLVTSASINTVVTGAFAADDTIYLGSGYTLNATGDLAKGSDSTLEVFFKANGADTDVYVEQKAFGSSVAGAAGGVTGDIIKLTLTGVAADKLVFVDGMITVAA